MNFKKFFYVLVTVSLLGILVPSVQARAVKSSFYGPNDPGYTCSGGGNAIGSTFGSAAINLSSKPGKPRKVAVEVALKGAVPNTSYQIYISQDPGNLALCIVTSPQGLVTTDAYGNAFGEFSISKGADAIHFWVSATGGGQTLRTPAVTLN